MIPMTKKMTDNQQNKNMIQHIRTIILISSKLLFLLMGSYYLFETYILEKITYKIAILDVLKLIPGVGHLISYFQFLDTLSLLFLAIPMAIVATSLFIEGGKMLKIFSALFSFDGITLFIPRFSKLINYSEGVKAGIISIYNTDSLEKKENYLREALAKILEKEAATMESPRQFLEFLKTYINDEWYFMKLHLKTMNMEEVDEYAKKLAETTIKKYQLFLEKITENTVSHASTITQIVSNESSIPYLKIIAYSVVSLTVLFGAVYVYKRLQGEDTTKLAEGGGLMVTGEQQNLNTTVRTAKLGESDGRNLDMDNRDHQDLQTCLNGTKMLTAELTQVKNRIATLEEQDKQVAVPPVLVLSLIYDKNFSVTSGVATFLFFELRPNSETIFGSLIIFINPNTERPICSASFNVMFDLVTIFPRDNMVLLMIFTFCMLHSFITKF